MKTTIVSLAIVFFARITFAGDAYLDAMQKNIMTVYTASDISQLQAAVNTFERIGTAEKTKWEPFYYEAFGYVMMSIHAPENAKKDSYLGLAEASMLKAKSIVPNESEVVALEGFIQMMKINIDPASRGQQFSGKAMNTLRKAVDLNSNNPRALALLAQMQFGTAKFFNSATTEACNTADKATEKFATFKSDNPLAPQWGKSMIDQLKSDCGK